MSNRKLDTDACVYFYEQEFYVLSNFSAFKLQWRERIFDTAEHAYHWEKFTTQSGISTIADKSWLIEVEIKRQIIRDHLHKLTMSAHEAYQYAHDNQQYVREDWDKIKLDRMYRIIFAKANQHDYVMRKLLQTGKRVLIEDSWRDSYWGWGEDMMGKNVLGRLWMKVRADVQGLPFNGLDDMITTLE